MDDEELERFVAIHGEPYRRLIADALAFIRGHPASVFVGEFDTDGYIRDLVSRAGLRPPTESVGVAVAPPPEKDTTGDDV
jgi:hypothetical protein